MTATATAPVGAGALASPSRPFQGTARLTRLVLRLDRVRMLVWAASGTALVLVSARSILDLYRTPEQLASYGALVQGNAVVIVQSGPGYGLDDPTTGTILVNEVNIWAILLVALMAILTVVRHTRAEEESGRSELVRAAPVGRHAASAAAVIGATTTSVLLALGVAAGLIASGFGVVGSVALGLGLLAAGAVFAGVGLVAAQLAASSRAANGLGLLVLATAFVLRAVGDVGSGTLSWASPIGWVQALRPFADERWWVLLLPVAATAALIATSAVLTARRDHGAGLLPQRPGRPAAAPSLRSPIGLAMRLHRGAIVAWMAGLASLGLLYGLIANEAEQMLEDNPDLGEFLAVTGGATITDAFLTTATLMTGLLASGYVVGAVGRLHTEERAGRAEPVLATATARRTWMASHVAIAGLGLLAVLVAGGAAAGAGAAASTDEGDRFGAMVGAALALAPGGALLGAVALLAWAVSPRWTLVGWVGVAVAGVVGLFAEVLDLPAWVRGLSPFHHLPALPVGSFDVVGVAAVSLLAVVVAAAAFAAFAHRDLGG